jgi:hypothetical protein
MLTSEDDDWTSGIILFVAFFVSLFSLKKSQKNKNKNKQILFCDLYVFSTGNNNIWTQPQYQHIDDVVAHKSVIIYIHKNYNILPTTD